MDRRLFMASAAATLIQAEAPSSVSDGQWVKLPTEPYRGKQDDIALIDPMIGWYGNGAGKVFKTTDGGRQWSQVMDRPGTFVRALGFIDAATGFIGNIGLDYYPGVTDSTPLYRTRDGGLGFEAVKIDGPHVKGICAIDVSRVPFINAGSLGYRTVLRAVGRVGGPAVLATSDDGGEHWTSEDLSRKTAMILDVHFVSETVGFICGATNTALAQSRAIVLRTSDGGRSWARVYEGVRPWELTWKMSWPTAQTGFVTVQSYNPDPAATQRYVAKSTDGGLTWSEIPLADDAGLRAFGIGFLDSLRGWVGTIAGGLETRDGGLTWVRADMGRAVNKIRIVDKPGGGCAVFAIGTDLHRLDVPPPSRSNAA